MSGAGENERMAAAEREAAAAWVGSSGGEAKSGAGRRRHRVHPAMRIPIAMGVLTLIICGQEMAAVQPPVLMLSIATVAIVAWVLLCYMMRRGRPLWEPEGEPVNAGDVVAAFTKRNCPDCGYGLTGVTPGIEPEKVGGVDVGPERCPECTSRWPLVPPPGEFARGRERGGGW